MTLDDVREVAAAVLAPAQALAVVGPFDDADAFADASSGAVTASRRSR